MDILKKQIALFSITIILISIIWLILWFIGIKVPLNYYYISNIIIYYILLIMTGNSYILDFFGLYKIAKLYMNGDVKKYYSDHNYENDHICEKVIPIIRTIRYPLIKKMFLIGIRKHRYIIKENRHHELKELYDTINNDVETIKSCDDIEVGEWIYVKYIDKIIKEEDKYESYLKSRSILDLYLTLYSDIVICKVSKVNSNAVECFSSSWTGAKEILYGSFRLATEDEIKNEKNRVFHDYKNDVMKVINNYEIKLKNIDDNYKWFINERTS